MESNLKSRSSAGVTTSMMHIFQSCHDTSDAVELFVPQQLYLKPVARLNISVQLPQLKQPGKTISNWEVMERLKAMVKPIEFVVLKVSKSTLDFIRFEGEIESKSNLEGVVSRLDARTIKLSGFSDLLKVRAAEAKVSFPTRHSWDSYFRDAKNMNEMKPGERPDTIHISNLPCKWFSSKHDLAHGNDLPSEYIFRKVFEQFGEVRCVDIPLLDPYRNLMKSQISGIKTFSYGQGLAFEGYVQFQEYVCFVKAMDALRGMKLLHKEGDKAYTASIKVDFDKTKHLSEPSIRRRKLEREHLMASERETEERERRAKEAQEREAEALRLKEREKKQMKDDRRRQREEKRKVKHLKRIREEETRIMNEKIAIEERKLIIAQRKLESIRLLDELFERVKMEIQKEKNANAKPRDPVKEGAKPVRGPQTGKTQGNLALKERELRQRLLMKYKAIQEKQLEEQREKLRRTVEGKTRLMSVVAKPSAANDGSSRSGSSSRSPSPRSRRRSRQRSDDRDGPGRDRDRYRDRRSDWFVPQVPAIPGMTPMDFAAYVHSYNFPGRFPFARDGFYRDRGRGFRSRWPRYTPRNRAAQPFYSGELNEEYYKYFRKVAQRSRSRSGSRARSRKSRSKSRSKGKSKSRSGSRRRTRSRSRSKRSRSRSKRRTRSRSRSKRRTRSRSRSKRRTRSKSRSRRTRSRSRSKKRTRSRSRSKRRTRSRSRSRRRTRSRSRSKRRTRSRSRSKRRTRSRSRSKRRTRSRSRSRSRTRAKSRSTSRTKTTSRSRTRLQSGSRSRTRHKSRTRSRSKSRTRAKSRTKSRTKSRSKTRSKTRTESASRTKTKAKTKSKSRSESKSPTRSKSRRSPSRQRSRRSRSRERSRSRSGSRNHRKSWSSDRSSPNKKRRSRSRSGSRKTSDRHSPKSNRSPRSPSKNGSRQEPSKKGSHSIRSLSRELSLSLSPSPFEEKDSNSKKDKKEKKSKDPDKKKIKKKKIKDKKSKDNHKENKS